MSGKGSGRRPAQVSDQEWADRWTKTFGMDGQDKHLTKPVVDGPAWTAGSQRAPRETASGGADYCVTSAATSDGVARMPEDRVETDSESRTPIRVDVMFGLGEFILTESMVRSDLAMPLDFGNEDES